MQDTLRQKMKEDVYQTKTLEKKKNLPKLVDTVSDNFNLLFKSRFLRKWLLPLMSGMPAEIRPFQPAINLAKGF